MNNFSEALVSSEVISGYCRAFDVEADYNEEFPLIKVRWIDSDELSVEEFCKIVESMVEIKEYIVNRKHNKL